jgi:2-methylisocitrate lyase-like PEP mutase family enzyme
MTQREKADLLRSYHRPPPALVLPNAWDAASAAVIARVPGCRAIATTSAGVAWSRGYPDGEVIPPGEMIEEVRRIAAAVDLPVTADLEAGYGDPFETARRAIEAGAVGMNLEDRVKPGGLLPLDDAVERVRTVLGAGKQAGVPLVLNARTDVFLLGEGSMDEQVATAVERLNAYLEAGADCGFAAGAREADAIERVVRGVHGPVSVFAGPGMPSVPELERLGVARISLATGVSRAAYALAAAVAEEVLGEGTYERLRPATEIGNLNELLG